VKIRVLYEYLEGKWYASSPDLVRWSAGADSLKEIKQLSHQGACFILEREDIELIEEFESLASK
jgi:hypothetical protein